MPAGWVHRWGWPGVIVFNKDFELVVYTQAQGKSLESAMIMEDSSAISSLKNGHCVRQIVRKNVDVAIIGTSAKEIITFAIWKYRL